MFSDNFQNQKLARRYEIGVVIRETFGVLGRRWRLLLAPALLLNVLPAVGQHYVAEFIFEYTHIYSVNIWLIIGLIPLTLFFVTTFNAIVTWVAFVDLTGGQPKISEAFASGLKPFFRLIGVSAVCGLIQLTGLICLIIPGIIFSYMAFVALQVCVVEGLGVRASIERSFTLTRGQRFNLWLTSLVLSLWYILSAVLSGILGVVVRSAPANILIPGALMGGALLNMPVAMFYATGVACAYFELRRTKEGIGAHSVADVFA